MGLLSINAHREGPGSQTRAESRGSRASLPWLACPLGPKPRGPQVLCPLRSPSFCVLFLPSCSIQQPPEQPALLARRPGGPHEGKLSKAGPARAVLQASLKILLLLSWATKKGAALGPLAPHSPEHKRARDGRCWCRIPTRMYGTEEKQSWVSQGQRRHAGAGAQAGPSGGEVGAAGTLRVYFSKVLAVEGGLLGNLHTLPQGQGWANPLKCQSYLAQILQ